MKEKIIYEYCVLRYVADPEREEFVNVGLLMMSKRWRWLRSAVTVDENRLKVLSERADAERLKVQLGVFCRDDVPEKDLPVEERYRWMAAVKSAVIQTSPSHPGLIFYSGETSCQEVHALLDAKFESLYRRLIL